MTDRYTAMMPFAKMESLDLDTYVTNKSLDGLFHMVGQEEAKIRTNPAARTTELLKKVFTK
jgi:RNA polymerase-interacting CarD/CdnL/TRCF family regulator